MKNTYFDLHNKLIVEVLKQANGKDNKGNILAAINEVQKHYRVKLFKTYRTPLLDALIGFVECRESIAMSLSKLKSSI